MSDLAKKKREAAEAMRTKIAGLRSTTQEIKNLLDTCGEQLSPEQKSEFDEVLEIQEEQINELSDQLVILLDDAVSDEALDAQQKQSKSDHDQTKKEIDLQAERVKEVFEQQRKDIEKESGVVSNVDATAVPLTARSVSEKALKKRDCEPDSADQNQLQDGSQARTGQKQKQ